MEITRNNEQTAAYFTGSVTITGQFQREAPSRVSGAIVRFEPGARTAWHTHPLGQTLIVTEGIGWTQIEGGPLDVLGFSGLHDRPCVRDGWRSDSLIQSER